MRLNQNNKRIKHPIKTKMTLLAVMAAVPFLAVVIYLIAALINYRNAYDSIVSNMTVANNYNLNFKEEMDESMYKLVVGYVTFENIAEDSSLKDPYLMIDELRSEFGKLMNITADGESAVWLQSLMRNIDTLEDRVDDIRENMENGGSYDENLEMLENNIYIMTELVQDDIQYYIY
ncbi:MAG: two-component sensor histidine kinase, partial [Lachnospiraceae bacterium]